MHFTPETTVRVEGVEMLPGTEIMADLQDLHLVHAHNSPNSIALVPQPSEEKSDPLNWGRAWKLVIVAVQGLFVLVSNITALSIAPLTPIYMQEWNRNAQSISLLTGAVVISLGYANFIIIPCANLFGRRPVLLCCSLIVLGADIWQATAQSYSSFLGARILNGLGAAANESIMSIVVADIFFLHERGGFMGSYFMCYFISLMVGPIIAANMAEYTSWRWFFWACTIAQAVATISLVFLFPETRRSGFTKSPVPSNDALRPEPAEKAMPLNSSDQLESVEAQIQPILGQGKPSRQQLWLFQPIDRTCLSSIWQHIFGPFQLFTFPIVFWTAMAMGAAANALLCVNLLQSQALSAPPYNFSPANVGFANFALAAGAVVGLLTAGPFSDWVAARATRQNGGVREAEMRLPALLPFIVIAIIGMTVLGVGWQNHWPWEAVIIVGFTFVGIITVSVPTITITYAVDCYKPAAGQIMVVATVAKNTFGFGMSYYINDWAASSGFLPPVMLLMAMTAGFSLVGMLVSLKWGKTLRRLTRNSAVHRF